MFHVSGDRNVGLNHNSPSTKPPDFATHCLCRIDALTTVDCKVSPRLRQRHGNCSSDPSATSRDKSNAILEIFHAIIL